ncbi:glycosyltransferase family 2 protein [Natronorubrum halophilum]|uniref:glycosyltransferase family 2 protein n=1 Tax=Natronorubrum halophilum TaxID=1702106 RepID=UPI0010C16DDE|nr:glycosyltransferase family 2 protein [Natronorubrum halophilum]
MSAAHRRQRTATTDDRLRSGLGETDADESASSPDSQRPAVGIVARGEESGSIYRTILRATDRGFAVYLTGVNPDSEIDHLAGRLDATVVEPRTAAANRIELEATLFAAGQTGSHSGIVFQLEGCPRIDYERTLAAFDGDRFQVYAIPESRSGPGRRPHVVAAIPAYNAGETIGDVVREAAGYADTVLVVDDGSGDATAERAERAGALVVRHDRNRGYGGALETIFEVGRTLDADHLVTLDADGQHDPASIAKLVAAQESSGAEIVIGSRFAPDSNTRMPFVRSLGLGAINLLTNASLGRFLPHTWVRDTQSGLRSYTRIAVESLATTADLGSGMGASTDIVYHAHREGFGFEEVGTTISYDVEHGSSQGTLSHGTDLVRNILGFLERTHPLLVLGLPGLLLTVLGTSSAIWSIEQLLAAQVSVISMVATAAFTFSGMTMVLLAVFLHTINTHPYFRTTPERGRSKRNQGRERRAETAPGGAVIVADERP